ncbi:DUF3027 domain-containing protein [Microbacterium sp. ZXX196]|uniref:DUF3027 domain-containing protein n=1 Tax=Microbacterium sp. ZXX196 TaxID=2609291 RepID=UPI0012B7EFD9|nr:DUF3027 domain-containing protein [Microbacterium sp. ZXX196]MTE23412.1 DUF3027 domain-containing protein [Microbacterium sp. ZXX196]
MTSTREPDERLTGAGPLALAALAEITPAETVGAAAGHEVHEDGTVSLRFAASMPGYPGWFWTVSVAAVDGADPTVLEAELLPGDDALVAPEWVPWSQRLEEYKAAQAAARAAGEDMDDAEGASPDGDEGEDGSDDDAEDDDEASFLHAGDVDGVDIDELDAGAEGESPDGAEDDSE